jgi:hypothetical protein
MACVKILNTFFNMPGGGGDADAAHPHDEFTVRAGERHINFAAGVTSVEAPSAPLVSCSPIFSRKI